MMELKTLLESLARTKGTVEIRVTPRASSNRIIVLEDEAGDFHIRAYVTSVPQDGKANSALIKLLAKETGMAKSTFTIISGESSRNKKLRLG